MRIFILFIISSSFLLLGCQPETKKPVDIENLTTNMTEASELFFKNIRQSDYTLEENKQAKMKIFRLKDYPTDALLTLDLMQNWYNDGAYLMVKWQKPFDSLEILSVISEDTAKRKIKTIQYQKGPIKNEIEFSVLIYNEIIRKNSLYLDTDTTKVYLFSDFKEVDAFRKTVFDYLRLTEVR